MHWLPQLFNPDMHSPGPKPLQCMEGTSGSGRLGRRLGTSPYSQVGQDKIGEVLDGLDLHQLHDEYM